MNIWYGISSWCSRCGSARLFCSRNKINNMLLSLVVVLFSCIPFVCRGIILWDTSVCGSTRAYVAAAVEFLWFSAVVVTSFAASQSILEHSRLFFRVMLINVSGQSTQILSLLPSYCHYCRYNEWMGIVSVEVDAAFCIRFCRNYRHF